jgi:hypothetical protein
MILGSIDVLDYAASGLTLATFAQKTMLPMCILDRHHGASINSRIALV